MVLGQSRNNQTCAGHYLTTPETPVVIENDYDIWDDSQSDSVSNNDLGIQTELSNGSEKSSIGKLINLINRL